MSDSCTADSKANLTPVQWGICPNAQIFGGIERASELLPSCFSGPCPVLLCVTCGSSADGEGAG